MKEFPLSSTTYHKLQLYHLTTEFTFICKTKNIISLFSLELFVS